VFGLCSFVGADAQCSQDASHENDVDGGVWQTDAWAAEQHSFCESTKQSCSEVFTPRYCSHFSPRLEHFTPEWCEFLCTGHSYSELGTTVFRTPRNSEPSRGVSTFPRYSVEFGIGRCILLFFSLNWSLRDTFDTSVSLLKSTEYTLAFWTLSITRPGPTLIFRIFPWHFASWTFVAIFKTIKHSTADHKT